MEQRPLGASGLEVSALSLGSWQTFECIPREDGLAVMAAAREAGITFLDDARYDDPTGHAPIATGYSEIVFGEVFRASGWPRDQVVVANKLWWEFWPRQSPAEELDASLRRMAFDHVDLLYSAPPPDGVSVEELVADLGALVAAGKARSWGLMLDPSPELVAAAGRAGVARPLAAVQTAYSLVRRSPLQDAGMDDALAISGATVVATAAMAGGALTGKYASGGAEGRLAQRRDDTALEPAFGAAAALSELADEVAITPAALAIAFALSHPRVASVLFGATSAAQITENARAAALLPLDDDVLERLSEISG